MTHDELMKTLKICSKTTTDCDKCPLNTSTDCQTIMARNALAELETAQIVLKTQEDKMSEVAKKYDPVEIVRTALAKGGYSVTVDQTGEVYIRPWQKTARWIKADKDNIWHCSACGYHFGWQCKTYKFCPKCGAEMEEDDE